MIITGGKGTRLAPYTNALPKGLLPIGSQPILEIIVKQLRSYGFDRITMACGYLAPLIQSYFIDGKKWGVDIDYILENKPLGTAGPLKGLQNVTEPFLVMNCDVLTTLDFKKLWNFHCNKHGLLTIAAQKKSNILDYGVLETEGDIVIDIIEKPKVDAYINMGIYVMSPIVLDYIPEQTFFNIPELIRCLLDDQKKILHFSNNDFWLDIGRPSDYVRANKEYPKMIQLLLPGKQDAEINTMSQPAEPWGMSDQ
ncbi:NTP transferase domain-containing protein [Fodinisporobacter ferrooxydans]|uniref:NTP transferase domain-containing protein n=1 Tax=Fodinisporobacter ferrooxydans TaxID=2901836 RepID=A0ABY4CTG2_9BACL|nr:NTP transferase domain-containing protein [Alicyclobacillaceae bacterium MYW30-H2]